jgi:septum site-determining protein MinC
VSTGLADERDFRLWTLTPTAPVMRWLGAFAERYPQGWEGGPVVLDLSQAPLHGPGLRAVLSELAVQGVRVAALEGAQIEDFGVEAERLPPLLTSGRPVEAGSPAARGVPRGVFQGKGLRSGQVLRHEGDVAIRGGVASGAEVVAGGSIHVYGALNGRAVCEAAAARIFAQRMTAEVLGIGGFFLTAEDIPPALHGRAAMAWLEGEQIRLEALEP